ncbi:hypothetical protein JN531_016995 (plasmid) [Flagellatimonas centrodinii]|uniref:hypothetical protein n=1 Tax=Flagellatimonas centrodinii TaxID=2806210 RepID=UPI001FEDC8FB|nr:hypothetical protein [Flagellatimonas centrodinii]ULQ48330.1 hypothetical protein JN531_016995 [Flagellatimonas centrodinii]
MNALEAFRFLGLRYEYLMVGVLCFVVLHIALRGPLGPLGPFVALMSGAALALILQKATEDKPGAWLQHLLLLWVVDPRRAKYWPQLAKGLDSQFRLRGVLPPSALIDEYEV